jgi:predicted ABC-type ATPase
MTSRAAEGLRIDLADIQHRQGQIGYPDLHLVNRPLPEPWNVPEFPRTLPDGHRLLTETHTIHTPEQDAVREAIVNRAIGDARPVTAETPKAYLMGGGGASGKGVVLETMVAKGRIPHENVVHLDPDAIKTQIPQYKEIVAAGDSRAAAVVHEDSSQLAKTILERAIATRLNIVYDVTLGNPGKAIHLIHEVKAAGYEVHLYGVTADADVAVARNASRAGQTGRYVPVDMQLTAHRGFSEGFERYVRLVDEAVLFDTNGAGSTMIAWKTADGRLAVLDPGRYASFQHKADINPTATGPGELYHGPRGDIRSEMGVPTAEAYVDKGMTNLAATSRTASGVIDTSASVDKAGQMAADLSGERAAALAVGNYREVLTHLYESRAREFTSPAELRGFVEDLVRRVNAGITRDDVLYREHDSTRYPSYTAVRDLPAAAHQFFTELHARLADRTADPVETAAWVEYRMDLTDHLWADGCGKTSKAVAAWVLMRAGHELPTYPAERALQFEHAPTQPRSAGAAIDHAQFREWHDYYRTLFPEPTPMERAELAQARLVSADLAGGQEIAGSTYRRDGRPPEQPDVSPAEVELALRDVRPQFPHDRVHLAGDHFSIEAGRLTVSMRVEVAQLPTGRITTLAFDRTATEYVIGLSNRLGPENLPRALVERTAMVVGPTSGARTAPWR